MCGISGLIKIGDGKMMKGILDSLSHRGPDDEGLYSDSINNVHLGHKRLSIIDLSSAGHQPMSNENGNIRLVFNGEIYNYKELRLSLVQKGHFFKSNADSEVIIHGYEEFGTKIFEKLNGMWAAAIYDQISDKIILSRDPAGIKPLYFVNLDNSLIFASEIKAIKENCGKYLSINNDSVIKFLSQGYVYGNETIYKEIKEVLPATNLIFDIKSSSISFQDNYLIPQKMTIGSLEEGIHVFKNTFDKSVKDCLQADVPVGIFLSGGIDSSLVGYYVKKNGANLKALTIGFQEDSFDESRSAINIRNHLGFSDHVVHILRPKDVKNDIDKIFDSFSEPFGDMSVLPTYYISKLAKESNCKVALTGDGGDELFGGYPTHYLPLIIDWYSKVPDSVHKRFMKLAGYLPHSYGKLGVDEVVRRFLAGAKSDYRLAHFLWRVIFDTDVLRNMLKREFYEEHVKNVFEEGFGKFFEDSENYDDRVSQVMNVDFKTFLTSDCLVKSDICSMANSVELRVPFLNRPVIDFSRSLPSKYKVRPFQTKILLRKVASEVLPAHIAKMKKQGFLPPVSHWLRGELKDKMLEILSRDNIYKTGFLNYSFVTSLIDSHLKGKRDNSRQIWSLMSLVRFFSK